MRELQQFFQKFPGPVDEINRLNQFAFDIGDDVAIGPLDIMSVRTTNSNDILNQVTRTFASTTTRERMGRSN
jgi:hypothetical protein